MHYSTCMNSLDPLPPAVARCPPALSPTHTHTHNTHPRTHTTLKTPSPPPSTPTAAEAEEGKEREANEAKAKALEAKAKAEKAAQRSAAPTVAQILADNAKAVDSIVDGHGATVHGIKTGHAVKSERVAAEHTANAMDCSKFLNAAKGRQASKVAAARDDCMRKKKAQVNAAVAKMDAEDSGFKPIKDLVFQGEKSTLSFSGHR